MAETAGCAPSGDAGSAIRRLKRNFLRRRQFAMRRGLLSQKGIPSNGEAGRVLSPADRPVCRCLTAPNNHPLALLAAPIHASDEEGSTFG